MKKLKLATGIMSILLVLLVIASCSATAKNSMGVADDRASYEGITKSELSNGADGYSQQKYGTTPNDADTASSGGATSTEEAYEQKIIKTFKLDGETKELDRAIAALDSNTSKYGGYIESSNITGASMNSKSSSFRRSASYTLRIPADKADSFLSDIGDLLNITSNTSSVIDVSLQYYDLESRLSSLKAEKETLERLYEKADNIEYILKVRAQLSKVIEEIEAKTTQLKVLQNKISYSTFHIYISEVVEYSEPVVEPVSFLDRVSDAFSRSWKNFANGWQDFSVGFIYAIPTLLMLGAFVAIIAVAVITIVKKQRNKSGR